jgi:hypothetical protein
MSLADFKAGILKPNKNESFNIPRTFDSINLLPTHTTPKEFVDRLEEYTENHRAVTHHFLENISCASFGTHETAELILAYFTAYSKFNSGFVENLKQLISISSEDEKEILEENLREEMGIYDEETLKQCKFGLLNLCLLTLHIVKPPGLCLFIHLQVTRWVYLVNQL